jgi:hypothetical protein
MPRPGLITVTRAASNQSQPVLMHNTNNCNQITLLELVAECYYRNLMALPFPNWENVRILRRDPQTGKTREMPVNVEELFKDCAKDMRLEWGDVVDIPEKDHLASEGWNGLPANLSPVFNQCLERIITVVAKGQTNEVKWTPFPKTGVGIPYRGNYSGCWLSEFLTQRPTLYLASSDRTRVKVKRTDLATGQRQEYIIDATRPDNLRSADLWLRQGDMIEIPEQP